MQVWFSLNKWVHCQIHKKKKQNCPITYERRGMDTGFCTSPVIQQNKNTCDHIWGLLLAKRVVGVWAKETGKAEQMIHECINKETNEWLEPHGWEVNRTVERWTAPGTCLWGCFSSHPRPEWGLPPRGVPPAGPGSVSPGAGAPARTPPSSTPAPPSLRGGQHPKMFSTQQFNLFREQGSTQGADSHHVNRRTKWQLPHNHNSTVLHEKLIKI